MIDASIRSAPADLVARARRIASGELHPPRPRHAATVLLLRDAPGGLELYVLRRRETMAVAAGRYAFPGGAVDPVDHAEDVAWSGPSPRQWADWLGVADKRLAQALVCAAVRETFEESGVLFAGPAMDAADDATATVVADTTGADYEADRMALLGRELSIARFLAKRALTLRADALAPWAHWVTPRAYERRFDTRFFLAGLPAGQHTRDVSEESDRVAWLAPADVLDSVHRGDMRMLPPTYFTVRALQPYTSVADALAAARESTITPVMPGLVVEDDGAGQGVGSWVFPGEPGYSGDYDEGEVRGTQP